jgi:hypothetical protein
VALVSKKHRWLPAVAGQLPIPEPGGAGLARSRVRVAVVGLSVDRGKPASLGYVADLAEFAADPAGFMARLYAVYARGGPPSAVQRLPRQPTDDLG